MRGEFLYTSFAKSHILNEVPAVSWRWKGISKRWMRMSDEMFRREQYMMNRGPFLPSTQLLTPASHLLQISFAFLILKSNCSQSILIY